MNKQLIAPIASAVAIIGFFSPWMSCGMMTFSGMDLASGSGGGMGDLGGAAMGGDTGGSEPVLFAIPLAALIIVGLYFFYKNKSRLASAMLPTIIIAVLALVVMTLKYMDVQDLKSEMGSGSGLGSLSADSQSSGSGGLDAAMGDIISVRWGFWLTALGFLTVIYGAILYRDQQKQSNSTAPAETPPGEIVSSSPPPDTTMTQDKGMT